MKIGFIGAGKVGFSLGKLFAHGGVRVIGYYSRYSGSAQEAAQFTGTQAFDSLEAIVSASDALFLTVPDGQITSVYHDLCRFDLRGKQICHCSGAMSARQAFPALEDTGAEGYSIHPLFPVSSKYTAWKELADVFFCIEGSAEHLSHWQQLLTGLGVRVQVISGEDKVRYHAACAISSNLMCALVQESLDLLQTCGFTQDFALQALAPLMRSNVSHIIDDGVANALTGPLERCDTVTVTKHLACFPTRDEQELYRRLSQRLLPVAKQKNPARDYSAMESILKGERNQ